MYIIAGLGNPGAKYDGTRHNMGFDTIDLLVEEHKIPSAGVQMKAMWGKGIIGGERVILLKPLTYMNLSGEAIGAFVRYYKIDPESELIVIYDDIDQEPGQLRIRKKGSAGGHNGMKSIIQHLGTDKFARIRIGVGEKPAGWDLADHVLSRFSKEDRGKVDEAIEKAAKAAEMIVAGEIDEAMNAYNAKPKKKEKKKKKQEKTPAEKAGKSMSDLLLTEMSAAEEDYGQEGEMEIECISLVEDLR